MIDVRYDCLSSILVGLYIIIIIMDDIQSFVNQDDSMSELDIRDVP